MRRILGVFRTRDDLLEALDGLAHHAWAHGAPLALLLGDGDDEYELTVVLLGDEAVGGVLCASADTFSPHRTWEVPPRTDWWERGNTLREIVDFIWRDGYRVVAFTASQDRRIDRWLGEWLASPEEVEE